MSIADAIPNHIYTNRTLRVKIIDTCGLTCTFCHNEGTPVAIDNLRRDPGTFVPFGRSGRTSIYAPDERRDVPARTDTAGHRLPARARRAPFRTL